MAIDAVHISETAQVQSIRDLVNQEKSFSSKCYVKPMYPPKHRTQLTGKVSGPHTAVEWKILTCMCGIYGRGVAWIKIPVVTMYYQQNSAEMHF